MGTEDKYGKYRLPSSHDYTWLLWPVGVSLITLYRNMTETQASSHMHSKACDQRNTQANRCSRMPGGQEAHRQTRTSKYQVRNSNQEAGTEAGGSYRRKRRGRAESSYRETKAAAVCQKQAAVQE